MREAAGRFCDIWRMQKRYTDLDTFQIMLFCKI
jgi:hypothetical protein